MNVTNFKVQEEDKVFKERKIGEISFTKDKKEKVLTIGGLEEAKHSEDEEEEKSMDQPIGKIAASSKKRA